VKLIVAAIAARPPAWVVAGWGDYAKRMPRELSLDLLEIKPEPRTTGKNATAMMAAEATRLDAALPPSCRRIVLDEQGDARHYPAVERAINAMDVRWVRRRFFDWRP
jgi:23S rRNA (pseudouridine1915-N3)-methyltransferase